MTHFVLGVLLAGISTSSRADIISHLKQDAGHILPWTERSLNLVKEGVPRYSFEWENDLFGNTDKNYTNGLFMGYTWAPRGFWLQRDHGLEPMDCEEDGDGGVTCKVESNETATAKDLKRLTATYYLKQLMYTPQDLNLTPAQASQYERPYGGWAALGWRVREANAIGDYETYDLSIGCVGACSRAEQFQKWAHSGGWASGDDPQGWSTQVEGGLALQAGYETSLSAINNPFKKHHRMGSIYADLQVGQVFNRAGIGVHLDLTRQHSNRDLKLAVMDDLYFQHNRRVGGGAVKAAPVDLAPMSLPGEKGAVEVPKTVKFNFRRQPRWDLYFDSAVHYVAHNSLIEGMPFRDNSDIPTRDARPFIWSNTLGATFDFSSDWTLGVEFQTRSTEVDGQSFKWFDHKWGRIIVNARDTRFLGVPLTLGFFLGLDSI